MVVKHQELIVSTAKTPYEWEQARSYIAEGVWKWYRCLPTPLPRIVIIAKQKDTIFGTLALYFSKGDEPFPLEEIYKFDDKKMPYPFRRSEVVQYGRWIATAPGVSRYLLYASAVIGLRAGCIYGLAEVKPKIALRLREIGIAVHDVPAEVNQKNIPQAIRPYYELTPSPFPCMVNLQQKRELLEPFVLKAVRENAVVVDEFL